MAPSKAPLAVPPAGLALAADEDADRLADVEVEAEALDLGEGVAADEEREGGAELLGADVRGGATERDLGGVAAVASASAASGARLAEGAGLSRATLARGSGRSTEGRESGSGRASARAREGVGGSGRRSATDAGGVG